MGKQAVERGLTEDQINLFLRATESVSVNDINNETIALARVLGGKEAQSELDKIIMQKKQTVMSELVRMTYGNT